MYMGTTGFGWSVGWEVGGEESSNRIRDGRVKTKMPHFCPSLGGFD